MKLPFNVDLTGKVAVVTGAGGILCSDFSRAIAQCGAAVALLDINLDAAEAVAEEIRASGGKAIAVKTNCLEKASIEEAKAARDGRTFDREEADVPAALDFRMGAKRRENKN